MSDRNDWQTKYEADVVLLATDSREPIIYNHNCDANLVVSVGADTHFNREISGEYLAVHNRIFTDLMEAEHVGDLEANGYGSHGDMFLMLKILEEQGTPPDVFISVGSPLMDALTVEYLIHERDILRPDT